MLYVLNVICALLMLITAVARLNDMRKELHSLRWQVRRAGMLLVSLASLLMIFRWAFPVSISEITTTIGLLGVTFAWVTTPNHPPWWTFISRGDDASTPQEKVDVPQG